jgi:hypothetical protein
MVLTWVKRSAEAEPDIDAKKISFTGLPERSHAT